MSTGLSRDLEESNLIDPSQNANLVMTEEEGLNQLFDIYTEEIDSSDNYSNFISSVQDRSKELTGVDNNCSIENGVYAEAMVLLHRIDSHQAYDSDDMFKVWDTASQIVSRGYAEEAAVIGSEIDQNYSIKEEINESGSEWEIREDEDAAIL